MSANDDPDATRRDLPADVPTQPIEDDLPATNRSARGRSQTERESRFAPGTLVAGRFRIVNLVGSGGMGEVYRAEDTKLGQTVALKFVAPEIGHHERVIATLFQEVRLGRDVSHPNVARLYDIFEWKGMTFVAMEFIDGENLASLLRRIGRLPQDKGVDIARGIARGLGAAHARGVLHRDLKPANIMIDGRGEARITDFGLAAAAGEERSDSAGTPNYMAPELLMGSRASVQSDIYALGLVLYELFTGRRVRIGRSVAEVLREHADPPSAPSTFQPEIDPSVERVILRCLAPDPDERPRSVQEVLHTLPGGDRLTAAIAAGETPSPEALVAADVEGTISNRTAALLVGTIVLLTVVLLTARSQTSAAAFADWTRPPPVLKDRAHDLLQTLGFQRPPFETLVMEFDPRVVNWIRTNDPSLDRWKRIGQLPVYQMHWYGSRAPLRPAHSVSLIPLTPQIAAEVVFDLDGHLRSLLLREAADPTPPERLVAYTGLQNLEVDTPSMQPPVDVDERVAWRGHRPGSVVEERLEIGYREGRPVWLAVEGPWERTLEDDFELPFATRSLRVFMTIIGIAVFVTAGWFAWRNARSGRGDRTGAMRLALFITAIHFAAMAIGGAYPPWLSDRVWVVRTAFKEALYTGAILFVLYLALEPLVRRRWPRLLISWRRLLAGRWRDPLVGRDVLIGTIGGLGHSVIASLTWLIARFRGEPSESSGSGDLSLLVSPRSAIEHLGLSLGESTFIGLAMVFLLALFALITRRHWAGVLLMILLMNLGFYFAIGSLRLSTFLLSLLLIGITARYGLLATVVMHVSFFATFHYPLLFDSSQWFFWTSALPLFLLGVIVVFACRAAIGIGVTPAERRAVS
ncbi:MAG: serine/threonine protein kinase [Acidobacteria bacterium]|nr:serine/threonine protein kinase [Acidobacteriota bacterium]